MLVSMTMRSGNFWAERIRRTGLLYSVAVALAASGDGR
jgi:hypothetical protein